MMIEKWTKADYKTTQWSGGETTELLIYPKGSQLVMRDFQLRISSATVDAEQSTFSDFLGYQRFLQILEGEMTLDTDVSGVVEMKTLDTFYFPGDAQVVSSGKCRDFNVIYRPEVTVSDQLLTTGMTHPLSSDAQTFVFNPSLTPVTLTLNDQTYSLDHFEGLWVSETSGEVSYAGEEPLLVITMEGLV